MDKPKHLDRRLEVSEGSKPMIFPPLPSPFVISINGENIKDLKNIDIHIEFKED